MNHSEIVSSDKDELEKGIKILMYEKPVEKLTHTVWTEMKLTEWNTSKMIIT